MDVGSKIRKVRELKGFSQDFMANQLGISQAAYSKIEQTNFVNLERVTTIATIFEIEPMQLLGFDEQHIFNNKNQQGGNAASVLINTVSEKEREQYEKRIAHLEGEILFLRNQMEELLKR